ncbi:MAG: hypothetical protein U0514_03815 [Candidatus Andersenbacteria bacterium]
MPDQVVKAGTPNPDMTKKSMAQLGQLLDVLEKKPELQAKALAVRTQMGSYAKLLERATTACRECTIDLVLQVHVGGTGGPEHPALRPSQAQVRTLFEREHYDVIALEGAGYDPWTFENVLADTAKAQGLKVEELRPLMIADAPNQAWMSFILEHPEQRMIGLEDDALLALHGELLRQLGIYGRPTTNWTPAEVTLGSSRSEIGLAKLLIKLDQVGGKRGAIVLGNAHDQSLLQSAEWFGINARMINTVPSWAR